MKSEIIGFLFFILTFKGVALATDCHREQVKNIPFQLRMSGWMLPGDYILDARYDLTFVDCVSRFCAKVVGATLSEGFLVDTAEAVVCSVWTKQSTRVVKSTLCWRRGSWHELLADSRIRNINLNLLMYLAIHSTLCTLLRTLASLKPQSNHSSCDLLIRYSSFWFANKCFYVDVKKRWKKKYINMSKNETEI